MNDAKVDTTWHESTRLIRAGLTQPIAGTPLHAGPVFAAPFHTPGDPAAAAYSYGRSHNPTWTDVEAALAGLEVAADSAPASALLFASGLAAVAAVFGSILRPGDVVVYPADGYFAARQLLQEVYQPNGVVLRAALGADWAEPSTFAGARLVWVETPANPTLAITDVGLAAALAHAAGALVAVDNTTPTPLGQRPLELGADLSVASDSKALCGAGDLLLGHVATRDRALLAGLERWRTLTGAIAGPMEAWLLARSLPTLPLRLARSSENALALAEFLGTRPEVTQVLYPGLPQYPGHAVAARQMSYFGPVLSFVLADAQAADTFLANARLVTQATSFGGIATTAERRARWGHDEIHPGLLRMSAGCEDILDLVADVARALDSLRGPA